MLQLEAEGVGVEWEPGEGRIHIFYFYHLSRRGENRGFNKKFPPGEWAGIVFWDGAGPGEGSAAAKSERVFNGF